MKKTLITALVLGLVVGSLALPAEAKKKKKKPVPVQTPATFYLRQVEGTACADDGAFFLSLIDAADTGASCGNALYGVPGDVMREAGIAENGLVDVVPNVYPATDGIPFVLDATQEIKGMIGVKSRTGVATVPVANVPITSPVPYGAGNTTLNIVLTGTTGGESKQIGTAAVDYQVVPGTGLYEVEFTIQPDAALDKVEFTSLEIALHNSGTSVFHGFYTTDEPASNFTVGTWALP